MKKSGSKESQWQGTKTKTNLQQAFAGEAMANRKYLYFAKQARRLGGESIALLFEEIAHQETPHAFAHLELMYRPNELTLEKLLSLAIEGELYETNEMYPQFEQAAIEEGELIAAGEFAEQANESKEHAELFLKAAKQFKNLAKVEKVHAGRYQNALTDLKAGKGID